MTYRTDYFHILMIIFMTEIFLNTAEGTYNIRVYLKLSRKIITKPDIPHE